jgi:hypothetical protein
MHLWVVPEHLEEWWGYGAFFLVLAVAILWLVTRTTGIPLLGPHAGEVEGVGVLDLACTLAEVGVVATLGVLAMRGLQTEGRIQIVVVLAASSLLFWHLLHLLAGSHRTDPTDRYQQLLTCAGQLPSCFVTRVRRIGILQRSYSGYCKEPRNEPRNNLPRADPADPTAKRNNERYALR